MVSVLNTDNGGGRSTEVSIVIPTVNAPCFYGCVERLFSHTALGFELVIVCDEPNAEKHVRLQELASRGVRVLIDQKRQGVSKAINKGVRATTHVLIAVVSDDIFVSSGWLPPLVQALTDHPEFGMVSPIVERDSRDRDHYFGAFGEASLMTRDMVEKVGLLDESEPFRYLCADGDLYVRQVRAGYKLHGVVESRVKHLVGQTVTANLSRYYMDEPMKILAQRYGDEHKVDQHHLPAYSVQQGKVLGTT